MFELANWGNEILEGMAMGETIRGITWRVGGWKDRFAIWGERPCDLSPVLNRHGDWVGSFSIWEELDTFSTEAAAREFAKRYADAPADQPAGGEASGCELPSKPSYTNPSPAVFCLLYGQLKERALAQGYALAVHGSMQRDFDLVAVPWTKEAAEPSELIESLRQEVDGYIVPDGTAGGRLDPHSGTFVDAVVRNPETKPHGRLAWSIHLQGSVAIDVSVLPGNWHPAPASELAELRAKLEQRRLERNSLVEYMNEQTAAITSYIAAEKELRAEVERLRERVRALIERTDELEKQRHIESERRRYIAMKEEITRCNLAAAEREMVAVAEMTGCKIECREGGGPENARGTLALSVNRLKHERDQLRTQLAAAERERDEARKDAAEWSQEWKLRMADETKPILETLKSLFYRHPKHPALTDDEYDMLRDSIKAVEFAFLKASCIASTKNEQPLSGRCPTFTEPPTAAPRQE